MPLIQELDRGQIDICLSEAVRRRVPVSMTCRAGGLWYNFRSRVIRRNRDKLWLESPPGPAGAAEGKPEMVEGLMLGLTFKLGHHKHIFNTPIEAVCPISTDSGESLIAVCVPVPSKMQRLQRRAYYRVDVPRNRSILATFRQGGQACDKSARWEGWVTNISAGGFQVRLPSRSAAKIGIGDVVGVRIEVGQEFDPVPADAQFRQRISDDRGVVMLGFQFVGLNESERGRETLERIGQIVRSFRRHQGRRRAGGAA